MEKKCEKIVLQKLKEIFENQEGELNIKVFSRPKKDSTEIEWTVKGGPTYRGQKKNEKI